MSESARPRADILRTRDLVGWTVSDARGAKVGTVNDVLIDRSGCIRFLAVDLGLFRKSVLLPVEALEWGEAAMVLNRWGVDDIKPLPTYHADRPLSRELLEEMERAHPRLYGAHGTAELQAGDAEGERLVPLNEARDFRLGKGAPDPRGWNVFGADGERAGVISGLLVDPVGMKVRYLEVDLADDLFQLDEDRHVLVPSDAVDLRERGKDAWVTGLAARDLARLPAYTGGMVDPVTQRLTDDAFAGGEQGRALGSGSPGVRVEEEVPPHLPPPARGDLPPRGEDERLA